MLVCQRQADGSCRSPRSILRLFDGSLSSYGILDANGQNVFRADPTFSRVAEIISTAFDANGGSDASNIVAAGQPNIQALLNYVLGSG